MSLIVFTCPTCSRRGEFDRLPEDPPEAARATLVCPDCDDGDFHQPHYFTATGEEVLWRPDWDQPA